MVKTIAMKKEDGEKLGPHYFAADFFRSTQYGTRPLEIPGPRDDAATAAVFCLHQFPLFFFFR
jgi:hypothetical protein